MIAMRNRLMHGYAAVDRDIVWDVLARHATDLEEKLFAIATETPRPE